MNKTIIYLIKCRDSEIKEQYVGSTNNLKQRIYSHKSNCNNSNSKRYNLKVYKYIREHGGFDDFVFEILEEIEFETKKEKLSIERYYMEELKTTLNMDKTGRTKKEYNKANKEKIKEQSNQYYKANKEKIREYQKIKMTCECGSTFIKKEKSRHYKTHKHIKYIKLNNIEII